MVENKNNNNHKNKKKDFTVFSAGLMKFLVRKGFDFHSFRVAKEDTNTILYFFTDSDELRLAVEEYKKDSDNKNL